MSLSWTNNATNATCYMVVRSTATTGMWTLIATNLPGTATSYVNTNVAFGTTYNYQVVAFAGTAASHYSNVASARVLPAAPTNLAAAASTSTASVSLSWTDNATNATCYMVVRSIGTTGVWTLIATNLPGRATSYVNNVTAGTTYSYQVVAFAGEVASPFSNVASVVVSTVTTSSKAAG